MVKRPAASGGAQVGNLHNQGAAIVLTVDGGAKGGVFNAILGYGAPKEATLSLDVNGAKQSARLPKTGGWSTYKSVRMSVTLKPGEANRVVVQCRGGNLDYLELAEQN